MALTPTPPPALPPDVPPGLPSDLQLWPQGDEPRYDYCLLPYPRQPATAATEWMSVNLLRASWADHCVLDEGDHLLRRLRNGLGVGQVVWGIKHRHLHDNRDEAVSWELYFYRRPHNPPEFDLPRIAGLFAPIAVLAALPPGLPWLMVSVEMDIYQLRGERPCHASVYVPTTGLSYRAWPDQPPELENHYLFRDPRREMSDILAALTASTHLPRTPRALAQVLPPQLLACHHICVANKRRADAVYFSRLDVHQVDWFLRRHGWPERFLTAWQRQKPGLGHLVLDVGVDFRGGVAAAENAEVGAAASLHFCKSGLYGAY